MTATLSLTARHFWEKASIEHSERIGTLETCDQSDEETRPLQQNDKDNGKDNDKDNGNDNGNENDKDKENYKENDKDKYKIKYLLTLMGLYCGTQSFFFFFNLHLFLLVSYLRPSPMPVCQEPKPLINGTCSTNIALLSGWIVRFNSLKLFPSISSLRLIPRHTGGNSHP